MSMGKRKRDRQPAMWVIATDLPTAASHPFYRRLNQLLREHGFDDFVEAQCAGFYAATIGRPSLAPGIYFRLLLIGYFEGIDSERGIAWRAADSFTLRDFLDLVLPEAPPDYSTQSATNELAHQPLSGPRRRRGLALYRVFTSQGGLGSGDPGDR
jgi:transposase